MLSDWATTVTSPLGDVREVKNLGWLLNHKNEVYSILVRALRHGEAWMEATLFDGTVYRTRWASWDVCEEWIGKRRYFKGITTWLGYESE